MLNVFQNDQYIQYILFTLHIEISLSLARSIFSTLPKILPLRVAVRQVCRFGFVKLFSLFTLMYQTKLTSQYLRKTLKYTIPLTLKYA